ncbi:DUF3048 C-terminal domain-containing protein [Haloimpatiens sp. FM7330]|uniref:DUF3048 C-terminal domain-containing protein n=1 Tax=Haloimpatiens sp. FM7330 TaxID=3298610 RepID=UPI003641C6E1
MYKKKHILNTITLILFSILCILLVFVFYKFISLNRLPNIDINISPFTGKRLHKKVPPKNSIQVIYKLDNKTYDIDGLSNADIIFEYINSNNKIIYKALFYDNISNELDKSSQVNENTLKDLPKFNFVDIIDLNNNYKKSANSIFISFDEFTSSNFIYKNGQYCHYRNTKEDVDKKLNKPIQVSNVLVQFLKPEMDRDNPIGCGDGLLFCGGRVIDIKWNKKGDTPIQITDKKGKPISLMRGSTWWILINENSSVAYN